MSLLAPLYLIGGLAIALPILVHLIRRRPKAQAEFSSLMFLRESPPQLTKRSRLDDWPLLAMRALALLLLALAFSRPFWRSEQSRSSGSMGRRMVLLVDTSASMQRSGIREAVQTAVQDFAQRLEPADTAAFLAFDEFPQVVVDFDQFGELDLAAGRDLLQDSWEQTKPGWRSTNLGSAIAFGVDHAAQQVTDSKLQISGAESEEDSAEATNENAPIHLVIVSDFQAGSSTASLQSYVWPENVTAEFQLVAAQGTTNSTVELLQRSGEVVSTDSDLTSTSPASDGQWKARVSNSPDAVRAQFDLTWIHGASGNRRGAASNVQVPPGQSRVVSVESPQPGEEMLLVSGDDHDFDNRLYVIAPTSINQRLIHFGPGDQPPGEDAGFYLSRVPLDTERRQVEFVSVDSRESNGVLPVSADDHPEVPLVVLASPLPSDQTGMLLEYVRGGGHVLAVLDAGGDMPQWQQSLKELSGIGLTIRSADVGDYAIWSEVNFRDPLFSVMADPQFSDFSNLRFWSHRTVANEDPDQNLEDEFDVLVRFDDGDPGLLRRKIGLGQLTILTAGWQPSESQLALSTKFIPLVYQLFDPETSSPNAFQAKLELNTKDVSEWMDQWSESTDGAAVRSTEKATVDADDEQTSGDALFALHGSWGQTEVSDPEDVLRPGILRWEDARSEATVAVNLASNESQTQPMDPSALEALGVVFGQPLTSDERQAKQKQLRDVELESSQSWWRWILAATLGILAMETVWGGRRRKPALNPTTSAQPG